jgi:uroporphyrinogen III methyltransferase/synthase
MSFGKVFIAGAGPGDPGLVTLRAAQVLAQADVLLYDALVSDDVVAMARGQCEKIFVGKRRGFRTMDQREIIGQMIRYALDGKCVVRLKGGDPFVLGRGGEEAQALHDAGVPFEVVPGVSSAVAVPASAGIPVTQRGVSASFTVVTGHEDPDKPCSQIVWEQVARAGGTIVVLMGLTQLRTIAATLLAYGVARDTPVAVIENGTLPEQRTVEATLQTIAGEVEREGMRGPAVIVIGEVVRLRNRTVWQEAAYDAELACRPSTSSG